MSATAWRRTQAALTVTWVLLIAPSLIWWRESVPWLVMMSVWANVAASAAAYQGARAEEGAADREDIQRVEAKLDELLALLSREVR